DFFFRSLAFGDVLRQNQLGRPARKIQRVPGYLDSDYRAVFLTVSPGYRRVVTTDSVRQVCSVLRLTSNVLSRSQVFNGHAEKFSSGIAILLDRSVVDSKKA